MKYFFIVFLMSVFVIAYVWQNIEVMKMKMDYNRLVVFERDLSEKNDRIISELERLRSFKYMDEQGLKPGFKKIDQASVFLINLKEPEGKEKNEGQ